MLIAAGATSSSTELVYYIIATIGLVAGGLIAAWRFISRQRSKWTEEGEQRARQVQVTEENSARLERNTDAISRLTSRLEDFVASVTRELNGLSTRVTRLEDSTGIRRAFENQYGSRWAVRKKEEGQ